MSLRSALTQKYFGYTWDGQNFKNNAKSMPPYTEIAGEPAGVNKITSAKFKLMSRENSKKDGDPICFGMKVMLFDMYPLFHIGKLNAI